MIAIFGHILGALVFVSGVALVVIAGLLAYDDAKARAWESRNARRGEDES